MPKGGARSSACTSDRRRPMGWMAPSRHQRANLVAVEHTTRRPSAMEIATIGVDLAKHVLQVHGIDRNGKVVVRRRLRRAQVLEFFAGLRPCLVRMEACGTAHHWAREIR